jgi:hypothetical protein
MNYLNATIAKIEACTTKKELAQIEAVVNSPSLNWSEGDKMIINARINDVRVFWSTPLYTYANKTAF